MAASDQLEPLDDYSPEKDVEHYRLPPAGLATLRNQVGWFSVFFPGEPHLPQLAIPGAVAVRKVVVKIPARLVES